MYEDIMFKRLNGEISYRNRENFNRCLRLKSQNFFSLFIITLCSFDNHHMKVNSYFNH